MSLMNVPGLSGYLQQRQLNEAQPMQQLQQVSGVIGLQKFLQEQEQAKQLQAALQASGGDLDKALAATIQSGNLAGAAKLAPLVNAGKAKEFAPPEIVHLQKYIDMLPAGDPRRKPLEDRMSYLTTRPDKSPTTSNLGRLIAERDALPQGHPTRAIYDQAITKYQPGGITVNLQPNAPLIPGKPAQNKVDEGLLDAGMRLQQLSSIERQFKPEYQQLGTRFGALALSVKDKVGLTDLDPGEKQKLTEFSQFKRNSIDALNQYIKSVTGAAMTNAEAERILRGLPNPGTGLLDGDSPTEFKAKIDDAIKQVRMSEARLVYIKRNGLNLGDVPLERMPNLMNSRGAELEGAIKKQNPTLADEDIRKLVRRNLAQEFGLVE